MKQEGKGVKKNNFVYVLKQALVENSHSRQLLVGHTEEEEQFLFDSLNSNAYPQPE